VILNERGKDSQELKRTVPFSEHVYFTNNYIAPNTPLERREEAKEVFSKVFHPASEFNSLNPFPPCIQSDYDLLKGGLEYRFKTLRMDVLNRSNTYGDSVYTRQGVEHLLRLKAVIEDIQDQDAKCSYYEPGGKAPRISGRTVEAMDRGRVENLLRQFSFLVLQAMHPLKGYNDNMTIDPVQFIETLEERPIQQDAFIEYLAEYQDTKAMIPPIIAKVLEVTQAQSNVFDIMLESEITKFIGTIKGVLLESLKSISTGLVSEFEANIEGHENLEKKEQIRLMLDWLLKKYRESTASLEEKLQEVRDRETRIEGIQAQLADVAAREESLKAQVESMKAENTGKVAEATAAQTALELAQTELEKMKSSEGLQMEEAEGKLQRAREELALVQSQKATMEEELNSLRQNSDASLKEEKQRLRGLNATLLEVKGQLSKTVSENTRMQKLIDILNIKLKTLQDEQRGLQERKESRNNALDTQIKALEDTLSDKMTQLTALKGTAAGSAGQQGGNSERVKVLESEVDQLTRQLAAKRQERLGDADQLTVALKERDAEIQGLQRQLQGLQRSHDDLKSTAAQTSANANEAVVADMKRLQQELQTTRDELDARTSMVESLQQKMDDYEVGRQKLELNIQALKEEAVKNKSEDAPLFAQIEILNGNLEKRNREITELQGRLAAMDGSTQSLRDQLRKKQEMIDQQKQKLLETIRERNLEALRVEDLQAREAEMRSSVQSLRTQAEQQQIELAKQSSAIGEANESEEQRAALEQQKGETEGRLRVLENKLSSAEAELAAYQTYIELRIRQKETGLLGKVKQIADEIAAGSMRPPEELFQGTEDKPFVDLYKKIMSYTERVEKAAAAEGQGAVQTRDICYLNYFVTFFLKQLFFTQPSLETKKGLLQTLMQKLDQYLTEKSVDSKTLGVLMNQVYDLLYSSETFFLTQQRRDGVSASIQDAGYHVLSNSNSQSAELFSEFYDFLAGQGDLAGISDLLEEYVPQAFPDFFFRGSTLQFSPPPSIPDVPADAPIVQYPGFTFLRTPDDAQDPSLLKRYALLQTENDFKKTVIPVETPSVAAFLDEQLAKKPFNYTTLFTFFILMARSYMIGIESTLKEQHCSITQFLRDPMTIEERGRNWKALQLPVYEYNSVLVPSKASKDLSRKFEKEIANFQAYINQKDRVPPLEDLLKLRTEIESWKTKATRDLANSVAQKFNALITNYRTSTGQSSIRYYGADSLPQIKAKN
jgi:hypothetical protein